MPTIQEVAVGAFRCLGFFCISVCISYALVRIFGKKEPDLRESFERACQKNNENKS